MSSNATTVVSFRTDKKTKKEAGKIFEEMGMSFSTAINMFLKQTVMTKRLPFLPTAEWMEEVEFDKETLAALKETDEIMDGKIQRKGHRNVHEMFEEILTDAKKA